MVFDEIDTGISGRMAQVVAEKMSQIGDHHQVICVTHLPQIAAMADAQYLVCKYDENGATRTEVTRLNDAQRAPGNCTHGWWSCLRKRKQCAPCGSHAC